MAEAVFAHRLKLEGLDKKVIVDSAGTGDWHKGSSPHFGTQHTLIKNGIKYYHQARTLHSSDYDKFDLILAMDDDNYQEILRRRAGRAEVRKLLEFAMDCGFDDVPDPYYSGNFDETFELVSAASDGLMEWVIERLQEKQTR
jgi:protein-tyrosine phosphatase